jgi:hypothetical protein
MGEENVETIVEIEENQQTRRSGNESQIRKDQNQRNSAKLSRFRMMGKMER